MLEMNLAELKQEIKVLIIQTTKIPDIQPEDIIDDDPIFVEGLGLDSIDSLEIIMAIQRNYDIHIDNQDNIRFILQSVNTIADFIIKEKSK
jgi:acyl carrier protein